MIIDMKPVSLAEVKEIVGNLEEKKELKDYLKKYDKKLKSDAVQKMVDELRGLGNLKIKEQDLVKIADFLPKSAEELNKIFSEISLDEKETNEVLEIVKRY